MNNSFTYFMRDICLKKQNHATHKLQTLKLPILCSFALIFSFPSTADISQAVQNDNNRIEETATDLDKGYPTRKTDTLHTTSYRRDHRIGAINRYIQSVYFTPKAAGLILSFQHWPAPNTEEMILKLLNMEGLKRTRIVDEQWEVPNEKTTSHWKMWFLEWPEPRYDKEAEKICQKLPEIPQLKYCESDTQIPSSVVVTNRIVLPENKEDVISVCESPMLIRLPEMKEACDDYNETLIQN